ncbi:MAG: DUF3467 domain-containing protein [Acidobacteriaceae bacterium]|nr:DUF3467 domain-containing protein [Acidobacteriaceae bacterium]
MSQIKQPEPHTVTVSNAEGYRNSYANSVQVRMSVWDFFMVFGTMQQTSKEEVMVENFQGIYLSPQQAKALAHVLGQNLAQYEQDFGPIALEPRVIAPGGPIH